MKRFASAFFIMVTAAWSPAFASSVDDASAKIVAEFQKSNTRSTAHDIAIGDFVTLNFPAATFGAYFVESLGEAMKGSTAFKVIDQERVSKVLKNRAFSFNSEYDYIVLDAISQDIYETARETPTVYCYGQIKEVGDDVKISGKLIDAITGATIATAAVTFPSDETTDRLLGKPIREHKAERRDTVVVVKERVVEKIVEKPVEKPIDQPKVVTDTPGPAAQGFNIEGFVVTLKKCSFSGNELVFAFSVTNENDLTKYFALERGRVVDPNGNVIDCNRVSLGTTGSGNYARTDLISNVAVNALVGFVGVSPKLTTVKALQITAQGHEFVLRDIVIEK
jgi:TolB-like protein